MTSLRARHACVLIGASIAIASFVMACDLNPQPLPPGDQPEGGSNAAPGGNSDNNGGTGLAQSDGGAPGAAPPEAIGDAGAVDGALDGSLDGSIDGESDASLDAGAAAD